MKRSTAVVPLFLAVVLAAPSGAVVAQRAAAAAKPAAAPRTRLAAVTAKTGMVASAHALASQAGLNILKAGGNAVDAAVAAAFAIGVVEPNATGLGGEGMMVIYLAASKTTVAIDYRSTAPKDATFASGIPATGHAAVAVPGTVAGLVLAQQKYGKLKLPTVVAPAAQLAEQGFVVSPTLAGILLDNFEEVAKNEPLAKILCPGGLPVEAGGTLKNPDLAASLRAIGKGGADVFYRGAIANRIVAEMSAKGGFITRDDLASYRAIERQPVRGAYRGYDIVSAPPPVGGLSVVEILQILDQFDLSKAPHFSALHVHLFAEAMKRGFADYNAFIGDPDFAEVPAGFLLSRAYARQRAAEIDPSKVSASIAPGVVQKDEPASTTSLSAVDRQGNMASLTQTISDFFGAKVVIDGTGILLNNEMKNFSSRGPNAMAPGKRMRTAIAPTIVLRQGSPFATIGTPGAARIISTMTLLLSNLIDYKMGIQEAIEAPRFFARDTDKELSIEARVPQATEQALTTLGYSVKKLGEFDMFFGGAQGIIIDAKTGRRIGGADPRRDGAVVGYRKRRTTNDELKDRTMHDARERRTKPEYVDGRSSMIRQRLALAVLILSVAAFAPSVSAQAVFERPGLLTSVGQNSDIAIVKVVLNTHMKLDLAVKPVAAAADLEGMKTLVVVVGASTKGLGAAGLDAEKEAARGTALMKAAKEKGLKVLVLHTGGEARRGKTSNDMIDAVMPAADQVVVVASGNKDKMFNAAAAKRKTPVLEVEKATALAEALKPMFK